MTVIIFNDQGRSSRDPCGPSGLFTVCEADEYRSWYEAATQLVEITLSKGGHVGADGQLIPPADSIKLNVLGTGLAGELAVMTPGHKIKALPGWKVEAVAFIAARAAGMLEQFGVPLPPQFSENKEKALLIAQDRGGRSAFDSLGGVGFGVVLTLVLGGGYLGYRALKRRGVV